MFEFILYKNEDDLFLDSIDFSALKSKVEVRKVDNVYYVFSYKNQIISKMIWSLKFRGQKRFAKFFGEILAENLQKIAREDSRTESWGDLNLDFSENFILIPIPIHRQRRVERGFNQCELICESLVKNFSDRRQNFCKFDLEYRPEFLQRNKHTSKQSWKNASERQNGLRGVFEVPEKFLGEVSGRKIILVDDVVTTGSTIKEARRTLEESGASLVIAIAVTH